MTLIPLEIWQHEIRPRLDPMDWQAAAVTCRFFAVVFRVERVPYYRTCSATRDRELGANFEWLNILQHKDVIKQHCVMFTAARAGHRRLVLWLIQRSPFCIDWAFAGIAGNGPIGQQRPSTLSAEIHRCEWDLAETHVYDYCAAADYILLFCAARSKNKEVVCHLIRTRWLHDLRQAAACIGMPPFTHSAPTLEEVLAAVAKWP